MVKNQKKILSKEIIYLDILRIFACFMVIINHTNGFILESNTLINTTFYCITFSICKVGVPLFLMITGALVLNKNYNYKKILKCILRVFVPTFCLSLIFYIKEAGLNNINIIYFLKSILSNPYLHFFWYIYALIGVYLVLPFIQKMIKNFIDKDYVIFICVFLIVPTFIEFLKAYLNFDINYNFQLAFFPIITSIIICGNYISKIKASKKILIGSIILFTISYICMFLSMYLPYLNKGGISFVLDSWNSFPVVLMSISLFYIVKYLFENKYYSKRIINVITTVASTTFGIYLIHATLNFKIYKSVVIQSIFEFNNIIAIIILDLVVFIACMIPIYILKKIPFIKKFL